MTQLGLPFTKGEIAKAFAVEVTAVHNFFAGIEEARFFAAPAGVWSPAENLVHLIKSANPVIMAMKLPRFVLRLGFGRAKQPSRALAQVRDAYVNEALAGGGMATGAYVPQVSRQSSAERTRILTKWQKTGEALQPVLAKWSDAALDDYLLPHPLLGKMTVREILFFTLYHNMHHVNDVQRLLNQPESEWFESS